MDQPKKRRALLLSTYPIVAPKHGGQIRLRAIKRAYERAGWEVASLAVYTEESYPAAELDERDVRFPKDSPYRRFNGKKIPRIADLCAGIYAAAEHGGFRDCLARIPAQIDVVHVEQPWLWPLASKLRNLEGYDSATYIYGSANIEVPLKRNIFNGIGISSEEVLKEIDRLEKQAAREADFVFAVTVEDLAVIRSWGAKHSMLLPNGIDAWRADSRRIKRWRSQLPTRPWLLYVASAHPPNFSHFSEVFGGSLACIPPTSRLVVAGSVTEHIVTAANRSPWPALNLSRLLPLGSLPEEDIAALKSLAHGFVLPIQYGGGSNIKTAEALYSGAYVIGTPAAFRGYEQFVNLPEVRVCADPRSFQTAVREVLTATRRFPTRSESDPRQQLLWEYCLASIPLQSRT